MRRSTVCQMGNMVVVNLGEAYVWRQLCGARVRTERCRGVALLGADAVDPSKRQRALDAVGVKVGVNSTL